MKYRLVPFTIIAALVIVQALVETAALPQVNTAEKGIKQPGQCGNETAITLSGVYSPYSVHLIKAEVSGHVVKINAREGQILNAGVPIMEIDCSSLEKELGSLEDVLNALISERKLLLQDLELARKKYERYLKLKKEGHIEQQLVEDIETQVISAERAVIGNRQSQAETKRAIAEIKDKIKKSRPRFDKPLYVSQNFKEVYETVVPGENLSRLLDVSRAKIHIILSLSCFKKLETSLRTHRPLAFSILLPGGEQIKASGRAEKLKVDPDNSYLYSYGFDLVFAPIKGLLWGQVVRIKIEL